MRGERRWSRTTWPTWLWHSGRLTYDLPIEGAEVLRRLGSPLTGGRLISEEAARRWRGCVVGNDVRFLPTEPRNAYRSELVVTVVSTAAGSRVAGEFRVARTATAIYTMLWYVAPVVLLSFWALAGLSDSGRLRELLGILTILVAVLALGPLLAVVSHHRSTARDEEATLVAALDSVLEADPRRPG